MMTRDEAVCPCVTGFESERFDPVMQQSWHHMHHGQHITRTSNIAHKLAGTTVRKQFRQIIHGVRKYQNRFPDSINGGRLPKLGNTLPSDRLVINTAPVFRVLCILYFG